jgi:iron complex transport system permease protein
MSTSTVVRAASGRVSVRVGRRAAVVTAVLGALVVLVALGSLTYGSVFTVPETLDTLVGLGTTASEMVVFTFRMPRVVAAVLVGACLGIGGAQFQSLTRNPLGSPDIVGFTYGASMGGVLVLLVVGPQVMAVSTGAVLCGLIAAGLMYALAWRDGVHGTRLVLVGVAVSAMLESVTSYLLIRADLYAAQGAHVWLVGSLTAVTWAQVRLLAWVMLVLVPAAFLLSRPLHLLEMGDDAARALGVPAERTRLGVIVTAVGLTGASVAAVGPIAFVALTAPQVARRLTGATGPGLGAAALTGALLLLVADLVARALPLPGALPVGVVTGFAGGVYLIRLLWRENRAGRT